MTTQTIQPSVKTIRFIYSALMAGLIFFLAIGTFLINDVGEFGDFDTEAKNFFLLVCAALTLIEIPIGIFIAKKRLSEIEKIAPSERLAAYQSAMIVRAALFEGPGFFAIICLVLTGAQSFIIIAVIIIAVQAYFFPTNSRLSEELKIDLREIEKL